MANTRIPVDSQALATALNLIETLQNPKFRAGGPSSSHLLNQLADCIKGDLSRLVTDVTDTADQTRVLAMMLGAQNLGFSKMYSSLESKLSALGNTDPGTGGGRAFADFYIAADVVQAGNATTADLNALFGQAILPVTSRQNALVIERPGGEPPAIPAETQLLVSIQPTQTTTTNVSPPPDYTFGEDPNSVYALNGDDVAAWIVPDTTTASHMCWVDIVLPSGVSGAYRCNELELVTASAFNFDLVSVRAEVVGQGWQDLDFTYLTGYDSATKAVIGMGPSRLCFPETSITRFRLGLWCAGPWGFYSIRALKANYVSSATVTVDYSAYSPSGPLQTVNAYGKNPSQLDYLPITVSGNRATITISPASSNNESPVLVGLGSSW